MFSTKNKMKKKNKRDTGPWVVISTPMKILGYVLMAFSVISVGSGYYLLLFEELRSQDIVVAIMSILAGFWGFWNALDILSGD